LRACSQSVRPAFALLIQRVEERVCLVVTLEGHLSHGEKFLHANRNGHGLERAVPVGQYESRAVGRQRDDQK
jgi:hypothetical protein